MTVPPFPEPTTPIADEREVFLGYLDFFRAVVLTKVAGLDAADQRLSRLPSGWTPLELLNHPRHVERRWLEWGFAGEPVRDPWADHVEGRWHTAATFDDVAGQLAQQAMLTRRIVMTHGLEDVGQPGERWSGAAPPPLRRVLLHLLQEYARHCGHLDVARELADGHVGEGG